jgi:hypothetical protein
MGTRQKEPTAPHSCRFDVSDCRGYRSPATCTTALQTSPTTCRLISSDKLGQAVTTAAKLESVGVGSALFSALFGMADSVSFEKLPVCSNPVGVIFLAFFAKNGSELSLRIVLAHFFVPRQRPPHSHSHPPLF